MTEFKLQVGDQVIDKQGKTGEVENLFPKTGQVCVKLKPNVTCTYDNESMLKKIDLSDRCYIEQMKAWLKEQKARETQIKATIETSEEIVRQNKTQLEWHLKSMLNATDELFAWCKEKGIDPGAIRV